MLGLLPLAGLILLSGELNLYGNAIAEVRVGQAPVQAGQDPVAGVAASIAPIAELEYMRLDRQIILDYGPRVLWRQPNALRSDKPLILHVMNLSVTVDATPTLRFIERGSVSYGEADYVALNQIFAAQGFLPQVLNIFAVSAGTGLRWDAGRIWRYESMFDVEHREVVGDTGLTNPDPMPVPPPIDTVTLLSFRQTNLQLEASGIARVDRRNDLVLTTAVSDRILHNGVDVFAVTPQIGWRTRLARGTELRFNGGITYAKDLGTVKLVGQSGVVRPVGNVELNALLLGRRGVAWRGVGGLAVDYFVDPFLRAAGPRAVAVVRSLVLFEPNWTAGVEASFATSLRATAPQIGGPLADETTVSVALPVRRRLSTHLIGEVGLRWSVRAPRIRADEVTFHQRQTWFYISLTATSRRVDEWVATREQPVDARDEGAFARPQTTDATRQQVEVVPQSQAGTPRPLTQPQQTQSPTFGGPQQSETGSTAPTPSAPTGP